MPSSVIQWMRYEPGSRSLVIAFRGNGGLYRYSEVSAAVWKDFRAAPSKGTYLNAVFKDGGYGYRRLLPENPQPGPGRTSEPDPLPRQNLENQAEAETLFWGDLT